MGFQPTPAADVSAASASYLANVLPELMKLPAAERFDRLATHFETSILAYCNQVGGRIVQAEPSRN